MSNKKTYIDPYELEQLGISHGENYLNNIDKSIFNEPYFLEYINGFVKGLKRYAEIQKEHQLICKLNEIRDQIDN